MGSAGRSGARGDPFRLAHHHEMQISRAQRSTQNADMLHDALHADVLKALLAAADAQVNLSTTCRS